MSYLKQFLVAHHIVQLALSRHVLSVCENDEAFHSRTSCLQLGHEVYKCQVHHDVLILGMINNVLQITLKESAI